MGSYLNPGSKGFQESLNSEIYVDKTGLIEKTNMDGLQDAVVRMLAGEAIKINTGTFSNDMTTFASKDDVLTLLVHLGYLTYNSIDESVTIPNKEVSQEYVNALSTMNWHGVTASDIQKIANA